MSAWQVQEAENKLSELIDRASTEGPQIITRREIEVAVVMSIASCKKLAKRNRRLGDFFGFAIVRKRDSRRTAIAMKANEPHG